MNAIEHLAWAKERASEYLDLKHVGGDAAAISDSITSMISDLGKHPDLAALRMHAVMTSPFSGGKEDVREWLSKMHAPAEGAPDPLVP